MIAEIVVHSKPIILAAVGGNIKFFQSLLDMPITVVFYHDQVLSPHLCIIMS